nr:uncharacterized protein LOC109176608 [Ipomoea batatas]
MKLRQRLKASASGLRPPDEESKFRAVRQIESGTKELVVIEEETDVNYLSLLALILNCSSQNGVSFGKFMSPPSPKVCDVPNVLNIVSLAELMNNTLCGPSLKEVVMMAANMWVIWNTKNDVVWNGAVWFVHGMKR